MGLFNLFKKGKKDEQSSLLVLGQQCLDRWELDRALELLARAQEEAPDSIDALCAYARALLETGHLPDAQKLTQHALALAPDNVRVLLLAATASKELNDPENALRHIDTAFAINPSATEVWVQQANILNAMERSTQAMEAAETALKLDKRNASAHREMAYAALQLRDLGRARHHASKSKDYADHDPRNIVLNSVVSMLEGHLEASLDDAVEALEINPWLAEGYNHKGYLLRLMGRLEEAEEALQRALALNPNRSSTHYYLAMLHLDRNQLEKARAALLKTIELKPQSSLAHLNYARITKYAPDSPHIQVMENLLATSTASDTTRMGLHFALGKAYEDTGAYDQAFGHLREGNALKLQSLNYDFSSDEQAVNGVLTTFSQELFQQAEETRSGPEEMLPNASEVLFIIGMPRSGSTLVEQMLDSHPNIVGAGETALLNRILHNVYALTPAQGPAAAYHQALARTAAPHFLAALEELAFRGMDEERIAKVQLIVDKTLDNFLRLGAIHLGLAEARVIHCRRNPVDTCFSCYKNLFELGLGYTYDLATLGRYYRLYHELMEHWERVLPGKCYILDYESLVENPEQEIRALLDWLGMDFHPDCLEFYRNKRQVQTASLTQVRQPIYKNSVKLWRRYEKHLTPLLRELGALAN